MSLRRHLSVLKDAWKDENARRRAGVKDWREKDWDTAAWQDFLREIGYFVPEGPAFEVETGPTDPEMSQVAGPQLVVPVMNARFALNAANARWGSLYDALYGTDALPGAPEGKGYDEKRGAQAVAWVECVCTTPPREG